MYMHIYLFSQNEFYKQFSFYVFLAVFFSCEVFVFFLQCILIILLANENAVSSYHKFELVKNINSSLMVFGPDEYE